MEVRIRESFEGAVPLDLKEIHELMSESSTYKVRKSRKLSFL